MFSCEYCSYFNKCQSNLWLISFVGNGKKEKKITKRLCGITRKYVLGDQIGCDLFDIHPYFWCKKCHQFNTILACVERQGKGLDGCRRCSQGSNILESLMMNQDMWKKLTCPTETVTKPVIIKRRGKENAERSGTSNVRILRRKLH